MQKPSAIDMRLPHVKELHINQMGIYLLLNLGVGDRCAQFVAHNIKSLTKLYIGKQSNNSDSNNVGDEGATEIAKGL
jgi:hypothetical protein